MRTVGQLMKKDPVTVDSCTSVLEAVKLMKACNVESILVSRLGRIVGIVTESDIVKKALTSERSLHFILLEEIMSSPIVGLEERRPLTEAADLMDRHKSRHLGITKNGAVVGILSVRELLRPVSVDDF